MRIDNVHLDHERPRRAGFQMITESNLLLRKSSSCSEGGDKSRNKRYTRLKVLHSPVVVNSVLES